MLVSSAIISSTREFLYGAKSFDFKCQKDLSGRWSGAANESQCTGVSQVARGMVVITFDKCECCLHLLSWIHLNGKSSRLKQASELHTFHGANMANSWPTYWPVWEFGRLCLNMFQPVFSALCLELSNV